MSRRNFFDNYGSLARGIRSVFSNLCRGDIFVACQYPSYIFDPFFLLYCNNIATITDIRLDLKPDTPEKKTDTDPQRGFTKCARNSFKQKIAFIHSSLPVTFVHPFSSSPPRAVRVGATKPVWSQGSRTAAVGPRYPTISTKNFFLRVCDIRTGKIIKFI